MVAARLRERGDVMASAWPNPVKQDDGKVAPVKSVLAASEADDIAVVQVEGEGFQPLSVAAAARIGSPVTVISHPTYFPAAW